MADQELSSRMEKALSVLRESLAGLRAGRASPAILEPIQVEAYGQRMKLEQLGTVSAPEPRLLQIKVWDEGMLAPIEKAIRESPLGLNPMRDGTLIRLPMPELTEERRNEMVKLAHQYAEQARVAVRNIRRDGMEALKKQEKASEISQDEHKQKADEVQALTDKMVGEIDNALKRREDDILQV